MGELFIGHGGLDPADYASSYKQGMGIVAIPPGTTLQFYTDAGQDLRFGDFATALSQLQAPWPTLTSEKVTYNLRLGAFDNTTTLERWSTATLKSAHTPHLPGLDLGDSVLLCTGEVGQCPTDPRENRPHACEGILAMYTGELHWIACTGFVLPENEEQWTEAGMTREEVNETQWAVDAARGDSPPSVFLGSDPDSWEQHTANLLIRARRMLEVYRTEGTLEKFVAYFTGDEYTDQERVAMMLADSEIAALIMES